MKAIRLREGKERSLLRRHPWVFEGSVAGGRADAGETVRVQAADGSFLAWAAYSPGSAIRLRAWSFDEAERIDGYAARRLAHEPVARIVGTKEFWSLPLRVTPAVLVPRPETETVVEAALAAIGHSGAARIADLGVDRGDLGCIRDPRRYFRVRGLHRAQGSLGRV